MPPRHVLRILSVAPRSRGFGFVVLEGSDRLVDWGWRSIRRQKRLRTIAEVGRLFETYRPDVFVLEDADHPSSRRSPRIRKLLRALRKFAEPGGAVWAVPMARVCERVPGKNKHERAIWISRSFQELEPLVPPMRKNTMNEDDRFALFDTLALVNASGTTRPPRYKKTPDGLASGGGS